MEVRFDKQYLKDLYEKGDASISTAFSRKS